MSIEKGVIIVGSSASPDTGSGISTYTKELSLALGELGFNVVYICPEGGTDEWFSLHPFISPLTFNPEGNPETQTCNIWNEVKSINNLIGVINSDCIFLQALAPRITVAFVSIVHMLKTTIFSAATLNHEFIDYLIVISNDMYFEVCKKADISKRKICLIYNGVAIEERLPVDIVTKGKSRPLELVAGGGYSKAKGGDLLLGLIKNLEKSNLDFNFTSFGTPPKNVKRVMDNDRRFHYHDRLPRGQYLDIVRKGDIYLFPSRLEGCPMSLLEAMNYGLLPIATNGKGAMKEIIQHGIDGFILPFSNWGDDAFELVSFYSEEVDKLVGISNLSKHKVDNEYSSLGMAKRIVELLVSSEVEGKLNNGSKSIKIYKWHRLPIPFTGKWKPAILIRRLLFRFGIIRRHGEVKR